MSQRVLIHAPYTAWSYHTGVEAVLAHAAKFRGAEVRFLLCSADLPECDIFRPRMGRRDDAKSRPKLACAACQAQQAVDLHRFGLSYDWLGSYIPRQERLKIDAWAAALAVDELLEATWKGQPVGLWAQSTAFNHFRLSRVELTNPEVVETLRRCIIGAARSWEGLTVAFDEFDPHVLLTFNGRFVGNRVAIDVARDRGVRFLTHERGARKGTMLLVENTGLHETTLYDEAWRDWHSVPLTGREARDTAGWFADRRVGKNLNWKPFSPPPEEEGALRASLGLDARPVVTCFTTSDDEWLLYPDRRQGPWPDSLRWPADTVQAARDNPDLQWVIRFHPNLINFGTNEQAYTQAKRLKEEAPENCVIVLPEDAVSSYTLGDLSDAIVVYGSTIGVEFAARGRSVVSASRGWYGLTSFVTPVPDVSSYAQTVRDAIARPDSFRVARWAHRFYCATGRTTAIPFPWVKETNGARGAFTVAGPEAFRPGVSAGVDRLARILLEGEPVTLPPSADRDYDSPELEKVETRTLLRAYPWLRDAPDRPLSPLDDALQAAHEALEQGRPQVALSQAFAAAQVASDSAEAWATVGVAAHHLGRGADAEVALRRATALDPGEPVSFLGRALMADRAKDTPTLVKMIQAAKEARFSDPMLAHLARRHRIPYA